jgi:hypothetical protein
MGVVHKTLIPYPHSYPQSGRNPPEPAGAHRSNRIQSDPTGGLPRFRYAVPISPSSVRSEFGSGLFVARRPAFGPLIWTPIATSGRPCRRFPITPILIALTTTLYYSQAPARRTRSSIGPCRARAATHIVPSS